MAQMMETSAEAYRSALLDDVVPFWEAHCLDKEFGGYINCLDRDGLPYDHEKHMWMQWRIVYMFSELALAEFGQPRWAEHAWLGYDFLTQHGKSPDGGYYFALNRAGVPTVAPYNLYSDCFAAMGSAALFHASGREECRDEALSAMDSYIKRMDNPKGRWCKAMPGQERRLSLGHFMILANLGTVMKRHLDSDRYEADTARAVETALDKFHNPKFGVLFENVGADGSFDLDSCAGRHLNPGHGLEALWFIMDYARRAGRPDLAKRAAAIVKSTIEFAWDKERGGIFYFMDATGRPNPELQWDMKLWWVHCEALVALLMAYKLTDDSDFLDWFKQVHSWTWGHFPDPGHGEWFAYLNRAGEPTSTLKGGKWKCFFHLPRMLLTCSELLNEIEQAKGKVFPCA